MGQLTDENTKLNKKIKTERIRKSFSVSSFENEREGESSGLKCKLNFDYLENEGLIDAIHKDYVESEAKTTSEEEGSKNDSDGSNMLRGGGHRRDKETRKMKEEIRKRKEKVKKKANVKATTMRESIKKCVDCHVCNLGYSSA